MSTSISAKSQSTTSIEASFMSLISWKLSYRDMLKGIFSYIFGQRAFANSHKAYLKSKNIKRLSQDVALCSALSTHKNITPADARQKLIKASEIYSSRAKTHFAMGLGIFMCVASLIAKLAIKILGVEVDSGYFSLEDYLSMSAWSAAALAGISLTSLIHQHYKRFTNSHIQELLKIVEDAQTLETNLNTTNKNSLSVDSSKNSPQTTTLYSFPNPYDFLSNMPKNEQALFIKDFKIEFKKMSSIQKLESYLEIDSANPSEFIEKLQSIASDIAFDSQFQEKLEKDLAKASTDKKLELYEKLRSAKSSQFLEECQNTIECMACPE